MDHISAALNGTFSGRVVMCLVIGVLIGAPRALNVERVHAATPAACRDSRLPPKSDWPSHDGHRYLRLQMDVDGDGLPDVLEARYSAGSGFASTDVQVSLAKTGTRLTAREAVAFTAISAVNPVPKNLLDPRYGAALAWIEEALFPRVCTTPDPSLAWLLDTTRRLTWIHGSPALPDTYAIRVAASRVLGGRLAAYVPEGAEGAIDPEGAVWLTYLGDAHNYPVHGRSGLVQLARQRDRVLLGTAHGVILTNPERSRHAWIYVYEGDSDVRLRSPSIAGARLDGNTAVIMLERQWRGEEAPTARGRGSSRSRIRVNLTQDGGGAR